MANVLVFAETRGSALRQVALEAMTAARALADATAAAKCTRSSPARRASAALAGNSASTAPTSSWSSSTPRSRLRSRKCVAATIAARAQAGGYRAVVLGFSAQGRDLGPRVAAKLDAPIAADVTDVLGRRRRRSSCKHPGYAEQGDRDARGSRGPPAVDHASAERDHCAPRQRQGGDASRRWRRHSIQPRRAWS